MLCDLLPQIPTKSSSENYMENTLKQPSTEKWRSLWSGIFDFLNKKLIFPVYLENHPRNPSYYTYNIKFLVNIGMNSMLYTVYAPRFSRSWAQEVIWVRFGLFLVNSYHVFDRRFQKLNEKRFGLDDFSRIWPQFSEILQINKKKLDLETNLGYTVMWFLVKLVQTEVLF